MRIDLTITMGEDSKTMSLDEAKGLYMELNSIFGNQNINSGSAGATYRETNYSDPIHEKPKRNDNHGANPKVEAARNRAAKATSGCGSRR